MLYLISDGFEKLSGKEMRRALEQKGDDGNYKYVTNFFFPRPLWLQQQ
jgi:hypothetical protein